MQKLLDYYIKKAKEINSKIVYDEIDDERIVESIIELKNDGFNPIVVGTIGNLKKSFGDFLEKLEYHICNEDENPTFFAGKLLGEGKVDGFISGASHTTGETLKALFKTVGTKKTIKRVSGYFLMKTSKGFMIFADCAVQPNPSSMELAEIAYLSVKSARNFDIKPKVAMLSFSTLGSSTHEMTDKVKIATDILKKRFLDENINDVEVCGEVQLDAAIDSGVAHKKIKDGSWIGGANVLIFPDLNSGNIGYKLVQYFSDSQAIGPILQGLNKSANDLSRGCTKEDIKILHAITVLQSQNTL